MVCGNFAGPWVGGVRTYWSFVMRIYVGNMSYDLTEDALRGLFIEHGQVEEVAIVADRDTGRPRGFGFVTMADSAEGQAAITALNGQEVEGRTLNVSEAKPRNNTGAQSSRGSW